MAEGRSKGYVRLYRQVLENDFLMSDQNAFNVFAKLLLLVGREKGQWAGGRNQLAALVKLPARTTYDVVKRLEAQQLISIVPNSKYSVYHICNWHKYQNVPNRLNLFKPTTAQPQPNTLTRTKEINNINQPKYFVEEKTTKPVDPNSPGFLRYRKMRKELNL